MIVVGGENLVDLIIARDGAITAVPGGSPANTARTLGRLGAPVAFLSRVSDDRFGRELRAAFEADGVDTSLLVPTGDPTLLALSELDAEGRAHYVFYTQGTATVGLRTEDLDGRLPPSPDILHLGSLGLVLRPMAEAMQAAVGRVPQRTLVSLDPNCRPMVIPDLDAYRNDMRRLLRRVDLVKASTEDLEVLVPGSTPEAAAKAILDLGPRVVIVTDGERPVGVHTARRSLAIPVPRVTVVDTVGAGDGFAGGFLARWRELGLGRAALEEPEPLEEAARYGVAVAALTCTRAGARPPTRAEVAASGLV